MMPLNLTVRPLTNLHFRGPNLPAPVNSLVSESSLEARIHLDTGNLGFERAEQVLRAFQETFQDDKLKTFMQIFPEYYIKGKVEGEEFEFSLLQTPPSGKIGVGLGTGIASGRIPLDTILTDRRATVQYFSEELANSLIYGRSRSTFGPISDEAMLLVARMAPGELSHLKERALVQIRRAIKALGSVPKELNGEESLIKLELT